MNKKIIIFVIILSGYLLFAQSKNRWVKYDRNITIRKTPIQRNTFKTPFEYNEFTIAPMAEFDIEARLLSRKNYRFGTEAKLSKVDFALGWGPMSRYEVLKELTITQSNRWYHYRYKQPPILKSEIAQNSANMHLITANKNVEKTLQKARRGEIVKLKGFLVNAKNKDGWYWNTSLTRTDTGNGSCELFWVEHALIVKPR